MLLFVADSQAYPLSGLMHGTKTVFASWLFNNINEIDFDYIVVAIYDQGERNNIVSDFIKHGVPEKKIISDFSWYDQVNYINNEGLRCFFRPSFSWYGEDVVIKGLFRMMGIENPSYLDIGCNQPYLGNNTAHLYLTGSNGVNVDASSACIEAMKANRPDDVNVCAGVDIEGGEKTFYMLDEMNALNSFAREYIDQYFEGQHINGNHEGMQRQVRCYTMADIVEKYCDGVFPDLLDLDIEGLDAEVIKNHSFEDKRPKIICVESHDEEMNRHLLQAGFRLYFSTPHNEILVDTDYLKWM